MPNEMRTEEFRTIKEINENINRLMELTESGVFPEINFSCTEIEIDELIEELSVFFDVDIERKSGDVFSVNGVEYSFPLSGTLYDGQIITSSIYQIIEHKDNIYIWADGSWLYKISETEMDNLLVEFGKEVLDHKNEDNVYKCIDKFKPGLCAYNQIEYPYFGSKISVEEFIKELKRHGLYEQYVSYD